VASFARRTASWWSTAPVIACPKHDPEKWDPVFGKDHAQTYGYDGMTIRRNVIPLSGGDDA
jgi:hypothetical protein